jgi:chaperone required for assembly of F1-ATPase
MWATQRQGETLVTGWEKKPTSTESLVISRCYGQDSTPLKNLVQAAIDHAEKKETGLVKIFQVHRWGGRWEECQQKNPRALESVVLDGTIAQDIIADI